MTSSLIPVTHVKQQMIVLAAMMFLFPSISTTVESFAVPFSPSREQQQQYFSSSSLQIYHDSVEFTRTRSARYLTPTSSIFRTSSTRTRNNTGTTLLATSFRNTKLSSSEQDEGKTKEEVGSQSEQSLGVDASVSKFRKLKDIMWIRETLEDWTAAEFALSVEQQSEGNVSGNEDRSSSSTVLSTPPRKAKKRTVDYEKLLSQLTKRVEDMTCEAFVEDMLSVDGCGHVQLNENRGMGRYAYSKEERAILMGCV